MPYKLPVEKRFFLPLVVERAGLDIGNDHRGNSMPTSLLQGVTLLSCRLGDPSAGFPPLGLMYLAAYLSRKDIEVEVKDFQRSNGEAFFSSDALRSEIANCRFKIIGISLFANALPLVIDALSRMDPHPSRVIVLGGPGVAALEDRLLEVCPTITFVVRGEGELALAELAEAIFEGRTPDHPSIISRVKTAQSNQATNRIKELKQLPMPMWSSTIAAGYNKTPIVSMRGCPFRCDFCDVVSIWGRRVTYREPEEVVSEVLHLQSRYGRTHFQFLDDTFTVNRRHLNAICKALKALPRPITWSCFARIDTLDEQIMDVMHEAGCEVIFLGIESGSDKLRGAIDKSSANGEIVGTVSDALKRFRVTVSFIWGFPRESIKDFSETISLAHELSCLAGQSGGDLTTQFHLLAPTVGSNFYKQFSGELMFDEQQPLSFLGGRRLSSYKNEPNYSRIIRFMRANPDLCAPFYYFDSEGFTTKSALMQRAPIPPDLEHCTNVGTRSALAQKLSYITAVTEAASGRRQRRALEKFKSINPDEERAF